MRRARQNPVPMKLLMRWALASAALLITVKVVPGLSLSGGPMGVFLATAALALLNALAAPLVVLLQLVTLPLSCLTFGLWTLLVSLVANVAIFQFVGTLGWGFRVDGFWHAALGAIVMSVLTSALSGAVHLARGGKRG